MLTNKDYSIDHVVIVIDESGSMARHRTTVPTIVDNLVSHLARRFTELGDKREVRISVYTFGGKDHEKHSSGYYRTTYSTGTCLIYDRDVLRMPSIKGHYDPLGNTPLIQATNTALDDLAQTPQKHGDHAFLVYVITDGEENASPTAMRNSFPQKLGALPDNWTVGIFVPDSRGVAEAKRFGFQKDNISVWDTSKDFSEVGTVIQKATDVFLENRSKGIRSSKSLFSMNQLSTDTIKTALTPLQNGQYQLFRVLADQRIDDFVYDLTGQKIVIGTGFYELTKKETIQAQKQIAVLHGGTVYVGPDARKILGLPDFTVDVQPDSHPGYSIFVQSTALNRKLKAGTQLLLLTPGYARFLATRA